MSSLFIAGVLLWMFCCAYAGYKKRFGLFIVILLAGFGLNALWIMFGLDADPLSPPAMTAQLAFVMYAIAAVGFGWLAGRLVRSFASSKVDPS